MNTINSFSFQGVNGAYSELAGKTIYPEASSIACRTFEEMFECVREGNANIALVPIENSKAGRVADTHRNPEQGELSAQGDDLVGGDRIGTGTG